MRVLFIEEDQAEVQALIDTLETSSVHSFVTSSTEDASIVLQTEKIRLLLLNPICKAAGDTTFLKNVRNRLAIPIIVLGDLVTIRSHNQSDSFTYAKQVLRRDVELDLLALQIQMAGREADEMNQVSDAHARAVKSLGLQERTAQVVNIYSIYMDVSYLRAKNLLRKHARDHGITMERLVADHDLYLKSLDETKFLDSMVSDPPLSRSMSIANRKLPKG